MPFNPYLLHDLRSLAFNKAQYSQPHETELYDLQSLVTPQEKHYESPKRLKNPFSVPLWDPLVKTGKFLFSCVIGSRSNKRISRATLLLILFSVSPAILWFSMVGNPFQPMPTSQCGHGDPTVNFLPKDNSVSSNPFTIDRTFGSYPFWVAKFIDVSWDLGVARGMQFLATWVSYAALSNVLIRSTEFELIPVGTFAEVAFGGASISAIYSLGKDIHRFKRPTMIAVFVCVVLSMSYVVALPTLLAAITGYISESTAVVKFPDTGSMVPMSKISNPYLDLYDKDTNRSYCLGGDPSGQNQYFELWWRAKYQMACCQPDTGCDRRVTGTTYYNFDGDSREDWNSLAQPKKWQSICSNKPKSVGTTVWSGSQCGDFVGPSKDKTFEWHNPHSSKPKQTYTSSCRDNLNITIQGIVFDLWSAFSYNHTISDSNRFCYDGSFYPSKTIQSNILCLSTTSQTNFLGRPRYQFGFSTVFTSSFLIVHLVWSLLTFALWLEPECRGLLQRLHGFQLSKIRGAVMITEVAIRTTDRTFGQLIALRPKTMNAILKENKAAMDFDILKNSMTVAQPTGEDDACERSVEQGLKASALQLVQMDRRLGKSSAPNDSHLDDFETNDLFEVTQDIALASRRREDI